jgi:GNAT superfamily N-acetyltransferase
MALHFTQHLASDILAIHAPLAQLRIAVFRAFPYLYEGSLQAEEAYLQIYAQSKRALVFAAWDGVAMIGATTCIPLADETGQVQAPFLDQAMDIAGIFYFGESILLPAYRGQGLGHRFMDTREAHARSYGTYHTTSFCAVQRPADHPLRPTDYRPLDDFWMGRGYMKQPHLQTSFEWLDVGAAVETAKPMIFWTRPL